MLQIITNGEAVDLLPDATITLNMENPFVSADRVPVPYTFSYELPLTKKNLRIYNHPQRATSLASAHKYPTVITFGGLTIATGEQTLEDIGDTISTSFNGAILPDNIKQYLHHHSLGELLLGDRDTLPDGGEVGEFYGTMRAKSAYNNILKSKLNETFPDFVAAPIALDYTEWIDADDSPDIYKNQRANFVNSYSTQFDTDGYLFQTPSESIIGYISKILLSFRVGWIFEKILGDKLKNNIFNAGDWRRLMLLGLSHPSYTNKDYSGVWKYSDGNFRVSFADFMPRYAANDFIVEFLKLACASLYVTGEGYTIEYNSDILNRDVIHDWSDKVIGKPTIGVKAPFKYVYGYSSSAEEVPAERPIKSLPDIIHMWSDSVINPSLTTYRIASTGQVIESLDDAGYPVLKRFKVISQDMGGNRDTDPDAEEDETETFDVSFTGDVLKTTLRRVIHNDSQSNTVIIDIIPPFTQPPTAADDRNNSFYYLPQTDEINSSRSENLIIGIYNGMVRSLGSNDTSTIVYPCISHCNIDARGDKNGDLSLRWDSEPDGLIARHHTPFKEWLQSHRRTLKCDVLLNNVDIHKLDLRDKFHISGTNYFIETLSVSLRTNSIEPAEIEFIEAK